MERNTGVRITRLLPILMLVIMMNSIASADDDGLGFSVPQHGSEPVAVRFSEGTIDWEDVKASEVLQVFVGAIDLCCEGRTPVAGRYELANNALRFTPAFSFVVGQDYVARARIPGTDEKLVKFSIPSETLMMEARVTDIYPSGNILPENILRLYVHFSIPMSPHVAFDYIKLRNAEGIADEAAFMRFKQELWNEDRTRLTVLIDPGRIKRDVATNLELGPALLAGQQYTLAVDAGWPSADGSSFLPAFSKSFSVGDALRARPSVKFWQATPPCLGTREPLHITFDRPFDRYLLRKDIHVAAADGQLVDGMIHVGEGENSWHFTPNEPWEHEELHVIANTELEDVAGNNFRDLLDQSVSTQDTSASVTSLTVQLESCPGLALYYNESFSSLETPLASSFATHHHETARIPRA